MGESVPDSDGAATLVASNSIVACLCRLQRFQVKKVVAYFLIVVHKNRNPLIKALFEVHLGVNID